MARRLYEENDIQAIASAIREKNGTENSYKLREMAPAILDIAVSSETPMEATFEDYIQGNSIGDELNFPNITSLKFYAFAGMYVTKVSIPRVVTLSDGAFYNCYALEQVDLYNGLTEIPHQTFCNCQNLTLSTLPDGITTIYGMAFSNCQNLALSALPETVETIMGEAFFNCSSLALTTLPSNLREIGSNAFCQSSIAITEFPEQLENIAYGAFQNCSNVAITTIPASVKRLEGYVFANCPQLTSITFEGTPEELGWENFSGCENLTTINVPWSEDDPINGNAWCGAPNATINYNYVEEAE